MIKTPMRVILDEGATFKQSRPKINYVTYNGPLPESSRARAWRYVCYGVVLAGVAVAAFVVTPAHAGQGSMAPEVRVIRVSPSVSFFGSREERKMKADVTRDYYQHQNDMELEELRGRNDRALEADRAYYKKLEWQRKNRK